MLSEPTDPQRMPYLLTSTPSLHNWTSGSCLLTSAQHSPQSHHEADVRLLHKQTPESSDWQSNLLYIQHKAVCFHTSRQLFCDVWWWHHHYQTKTTPNQATVLHPAAGRRYRSICCSTTRKREPLLSSGCEPWMHPCTNTHIHFSICKDETLCCLILTDGQW